MSSLWWLHLIYCTEYYNINQSINEDFTSGSSPEDDVRDVSRGICIYKQFRPPKHTSVCIDRRESEVQNSAGPLSKASGQ